MNDTPSPQPRPEELDAQVDSPLWLELRRWIEDTYHLQPLVQFSRCTMAFGWNMKYRRGSRALCTLYPDRGFFTCMVSVGRKETPAAELLMPTFTPYTRQLYQKASPFNGGRWLMIQVTGADILEDAKTLISLRLKPPGEAEPKPGLDKI